MAKETVKRLGLSGLTLFKSLMDEILLTKVDKVEGKALSSNDFTTEEKTKLASLTNYAVATTQKDGLMSSSDKLKLDNLSSGAGAPVTLVRW